MSPISLSRIPPGSDLQPLMAQRAKGFDTLRVGKNSQQVLRVMSHRILVQCIQIESGEANAHALTRDVLG